MTSPDSNLPAEILRALARGDKIEAIKLVRHMTGLGLREAKDVAEGQRAFEGLQPGQHQHPRVSVTPADAGNGLAPGEQPKATVHAALAWWLVVLAAVGLLISVFAR